MRHANVWRFILFLLPTLTLGCRQDLPEFDDDDEPPALLSDYGLFLGNGAAQQPAPGVVPYDVNTPLYSDESLKLRFVRIPPGTAVRYTPDGVLDFPVGTILVKSFAYPHDANDPAAGWRLIETRLLIRKTGRWIALPYVWNAAQTQATLRIVGATTEVHWKDQKGTSRQLTYLVPNTNQCLGCHENNREVQPLGPRADQLNRDFAYADGVENQLVRWTKLDHLQGAPVDPHASPRLAVWNDPATGSLDDRARAWLDVNCAHCHNPLGPARTSGLDLRRSQPDPAKWGVWKTPIAAGKGTGGRAYDIVPGKPHESILLYRLESCEPGILMPELGRRTPDPAGNALIRTWIEQMK